MQNLSLCLHVVPTNNKYQGNSDAYQWPHVTKIMYGMQQVLALFRIHQRLHNFVLVVGKTKNIYRCG